MVSTLPFLSCEPGESRKDSDAPFPDEEANDEEMKDIDLPDSEMVLVPAGIFMMGCDDAKDDTCGVGEKPIHEVFLSPYRIDINEVTAGDYERCVEANACFESDFDRYITEPKGYERCNIYHEDVTRKRYPANCVSWYGADSYCKWLGRRLPTEAEWEKAARGTDGRRYPWGDEPTPTCEYVGSMYNDAGDPCPDGVDSHEVGTFPKGASPYGVMDMLGNVGEWVQDWDDGKPYPSDLQENPQGPSSGTWKMFRGLSYITHGADMKITHRASMWPIAKYLDYGFRCAK